MFSELSETRYSHRAEVDEGHGFKPTWEKVCNKAADGK